MSANYLDRDGVRIAHRAYGAASEGVPVLLSHGFSATSDMWRGNVEALAATRPVITWDLRGHGDSDAPTNPALYGEECCVADMIALLDHYEIDRAVIGGMSLGGYLSLAFHRCHVARVAGLLLVDTGPGFKNDRSRQRWNDYAERTAQAIEAGTFDSRQSREIAEAVHRHPEGLVHVARTALKQDDDRIITTLPDIAVPTLIVVGSRDDDFLPAATYMEEKISLATKVVVDDAGHAPNLDQPEVFNSVVQRWLELL